MRARGGRALVHLVAAQSSRHAVRLHSRTVSTEMYDSMRSAARCVSAGVKGIEPCW